MDWTWTLTVMVGVRGSYPEPAEAKLTPLISSFTPRFGSKYGGTFSFTPMYEAIHKCMIFRFTIYIINIFQLYIYMNTNQ